MEFKPGDVVEIKSCQSIFTPQHRVGIVGEIVETQNNSVTITTGRDKLSAGIVDIELTNKPYHRSCH